MDFFNVTAWSWQRIALFVGIFLVTFFGSLGLVTLLLVRLPADYFHPAHERAFMSDSSFAMRLTGLIAKNTLGVLLILLGILMSVPGVPGQGLLTMLLGVVLVDFPGKRNLEYKLVRRPRVSGAINALRAKFDKAPLQLD